MAGTAQGANITHARRPRVMRYDELPDQLADGSRLVALYPYRTADGETVYEVRRYQRAGGDRRTTYHIATQRAVDQWVLALKAERILYHLPELHRAPHDAPVLVVEGEKRADAAQVALRVAGFTWAVTTTVGGAGQVGQATAHTLAPLQRRQVVILPNYDAPSERYADTFERVARQAGATRVVVLRLEGLQPHGDVADWLAAGHDGAELAERVIAALALTADISRPESAGAARSGAEGNLPMYEATSSGLRWIRRDVTRGGAVREVEIPLTNFTAQIVRDVLEDDGTETRRTFEMEATLYVGDSAQRAMRRFSLAADRFGAMAWPAQYLGAAAILYPGQNVREHARVAIQTLFGVVPERRVYTHTGWRQIDGAWRYLHVAGAQGAHDMREYVAVALPPDLLGYRLPLLSSTVHDERSDEIADAVRASLRMLDVAPDAVTAPVYAAVWRAALGGADFSLHLAGQTGEGKSELAALAQQHFGAGMDARHLPAAWASTSNALESLAFHAKDALLVVDDFIPSGTMSDTARLHREAERLVRAQANHTGRQRMRSDTSLRPAKPPRGLILSTGEETLRGSSLRARRLILEHAPNSMDWERLSACQHDAAAGQYALAMAAYLRWCAGRYDALQARVRTDAIRALIEHQQSTEPASALHKRTRASVGHLLAAMAIFLEFVREIGALSAPEAHAYMSRAAQALARVGGQQLAYSTWVNRRSASSPCSAPH